MNEKEVEILKTFEKEWYQSKKFIAFLIMETVFFITVILTLKWQNDFGWPICTFLGTIIFCMGFIAVAFNGKLAELDMFVRGIALSRKPFSNNLFTENEEQEEYGG